MISLKFFFLVLLRPSPRKKKVKEGKSYLSLKGHLERTNFGFMAMGGVECLASLQILLLFLHNNLSLELVYVICSLLAAVMKLCMLLELRACVRV